MNQPLHPKERLLIHLQILLNADCCALATQAVFDADEHVIAFRAGGDRLVAGDREAPVHINTGRLLATVGAVLGAILRPDELDIAKAISLLGTVAAFRGIVQAIDPDDAQLCVCLLSIGSHAGACLISAPTEHVLRKFLHMTPGATDARFDDAVGRLVKLNVISRNRKDDTDCLCLHDFVVIRHPVIQQLDLSRCRAQ